MRKLFTILAIAAVTVSCLGTKRRTEQTFEANSTVYAYFKYIRVEKDKLPIHNIMAADVSTEEFMIMLSLVGNNIGSIYDVMDNKYGEKAEAFRAAQEKFGDYNPHPSIYRYYEKGKNGGEWLIESGNCIYYAFGEQISKLTITSDRAWSADYPAGKDLCPIFTANFYALGEYVRSGFSSEANTLVRKIANELTPADFSLMIDSDWNIYGGTDLSLHTAILPEDYYEHTITVTLTLDTGEEIAYSDRIANLLPW